MRPLIPALLLFTATSAFATILGPERPVSAPVLQPFVGMAIPPHIATDGSSFFAVWTDYRGEYAEVRGTRIDVYGNVLDPSGILIARNFAAAGVAWTGSKYLVTLTGGCASALVAAVGGDGSVEPAHEIYNSGNVCYGGGPIVSNGETAFTIVGPKGIVLDGDGQVLRTIDLPVHAEFFSNGAAIATNGRDYVVAATSNNRHEVDALRLGSHGEVLNNVFLQVADEQANAITVASDGDSFAVLWAANNAIRTRTISADFQTLTSLKTLTSIQSQYQQATDAPRAVWTGSEYRVFYMAALRLMLASMTEDGTLVGTPVDFGGGPEISEQNYVDFAALPGVSGIAVFVEPGTFHVVRGLITPGTDPRFASVAPIAFSAPNQQIPAMASMGDAAVAVWSEKDIRAAIVTRDRTSESVVAGSGEYAANPRVAFDGGIVWIAWNDLHNVYVRRYGIGLVPIDETPIAIPTDSRSFDISAGGGHCLVAFPKNDDLYAVDLAAHDIAPVPVPFAISTEQYTEGLPSIAWNGTTFLVAFAHATTPPPYWNPPPVAPGPEEVRCARVTADGHLLDSVAPVVSGSTSAVLSLRAASNGSDFYIAWQRYEPAVLTGRAIRRGGTPAGMETTIATVGMPTTVTSLTPYRGDYLVSYATADINGPSASYAVRVVPSNGAPAFDFAAIGPFDLYPLAAGIVTAPIDGSTLIAYVRRGFEPEFAGAERIFTRIADPTPRRRLVKGR